MAQPTDRYVRFDWAIKRLLRQKANFAVLEGFLTVFIGEKITIVELLESEANQDSPTDKFNRVDIKARNSKGEIIIVEVQNTREIHYLERILYGVAKAITEHISIGEGYDKVTKVYSISILYFNLGKGDDYLYHGQTRFFGVHTKDELEVNVSEYNTIVARRPSEIFPEYILLRVNEFNKVAVTPMEEWMKYLKDGVIQADTQAPGLQEARERLKYNSLTKAEQLGYERHVTDLIIEKDSIDCAKAEGRDEGLAEGRAQGREERNRELALMMRENGESWDKITLYTGLTREQL